MLKPKYQEDLQPCDATFHARDEDRTAHDGLVGKNSTTQDRIALLRTICDICHKKDSGSDPTTILDLVQMD